MMRIPYSPDLQPRAADVDWTVLEIGWLDLSGSTEFKRGKVASGVISKLIDIILLGQPRLGEIMGRFTCSISPCRDWDVIQEVRGRLRYLGTVQLYVPSVTRSHTLYEFSDLILHFIEKHGYLPPDEFVTSVLACNLQSIPILEMSVLKTKPTVGPDATNA